jgi:hypothetical protein
MILIHRNEDLVLSELLGKSMNIFNNIILYNNIFIDRYLLFSFLYFNDLLFLFQEFDYFL